MSPFPREAYRPLEPYAPDRRPIAVDLSDNTNRWGAHPEALALIRGADPEELLRYPPVYADHLRNAVASRFGVPLECVATGCGSDDLLDSSFRAAGEPGEAIAYLPPTFSMVEIFARMNGMVPRAVAAPWAAAGETFTRTLPDPEALLEGGAALIYLCRPDNPTGSSAPRGWMERLMPLCDDGGPILLVDEAYADFADDNLLAAAAASRRTLVIRTLSKVFGLAGLRVGFAVGAPEVIREVEKSRGPYKVNRPAEAAAVAALTDSGGWVPGIVHASRAARVRLRAGLRERGFAPLPSDANFVLVPVPDAAPLTAALRERGVAVRPFPALPGIGDAIRISVGPDPELDALFHALDTVR